jgi:hypothetical protein
MVSNLKQIYKRNIFNMRIKFFWNIMLYCLASSNRLQGVGVHLPEDRGRKFLRNVGTYMPVDEATLQKTLQLHCFALNMGACFTIPEKCLTLSVIFGGGDGGGGISSTIVMCDSLQKGRGFHQWCN